MTSTLSEVHPQPQKKWWRPFAKHHSNLFDPFNPQINSFGLPQHHQLSSQPHLPPHPMRLNRSKQHSSSSSVSHSIAPPPPSIFGARLVQSLELASVAISMIGQDKKAYIYGFIPVVVAKCGLYLKENATDVQGIFRISGSTKRMRELQSIFDDPPHYGKDLDWKTTNPLDYSSSTSGSTASLADSTSIAKSYFSVHDAANVLRRYLMSLPVELCFLFRPLQSPPTGQLIILNVPKLYLLPSHSSMCRNH